MTFGRSGTRAAPYQLGGNLQAGPGPTPVGDTVAGQSSGPSAWTPTVAHLMVILVIEIAAFAALRYAFKVIKV